jgi:hypothetical protein
MLRITSWHISLANHNQHNLAPDRSMLHGMIKLGRQIK